LRIAAWRNKWSGGLQPTEALGMRLPSARRVEAHRSTVPPPDRALKVGDINRGFHAGTNSFGDAAMDMR
jgi:hypothetical protein